MRKYFSFSILILLIAMSVISCDKQDVVNITDEVPEIKPKKDTIYQDALLMSSGKIIFDSAFIQTVYTEGSTIDNYSLTVNSSLINSGGYLFLAAFSPTGTTVLKEGVYNGLASVTLSKNGIDLLEEWIQNGGDTDKMPNLDSEFISYNADSLKMVVYQLNSDLAKVKLQGYLLLDSGEKEIVQADFDVYLR